MTNVLLWLVFGALTGFIADYIDRGVALTWPERIIAGIVGAFVGGMLANLLSTGTLSITGSNEFSLISIIVAVLGALVTLFVYKRVRK